MAKKSSTTELRAMSLKDLLKEIRDQRVTVAKLKMGVKLQKEKNTAKFQQAKKHLARLETVYGEKQAEQLIDTPQATPVSAA